MTGIRSEPPTSTEDIPQPQESPEAGVAAGSVAELAGHEAHSGHVHAGHDHPTGPHGYSPRKDDYLKRLRRIEGQVRGLQRMVEEDTYCIDVLTQISAATKALQSVSLALLEDHLNHCVVGAARADEEAGREKVREATQAVARLWKS